MNEVEFTALYSETVKLVRSIIYRYSSRAPIDDLTQETYIRAWRFREEIAKHQSIKSWIAKIAVNVSYDWGRKTATQNNLQLTEFPDHQDTSVHMDQRIFADEILTQIDAESRVMLELLYIQECSVEEASMILSLPVGTIKSRTNRIKEKIAQLMAAKEEKAL